MSGQRIQYTNSLWESIDDFIAREPVSPRVETRANPPKNVLRRSRQEVKKPSSNMVLHRCRRPNTFWLDTVSGHP
ncbi:hypothetical protein BVI434_3500011 [Burkholderia vietnamiensis]|nr:hypothetical protein BVI434_3500011 [Burkholderia vietnamiensis]